jgi:hypothetical protein
MKHDSQPATPSEWRAAGEAFGAQGDGLAALQCFEAAHALDPGDAINCARLAGTLAALNRFPEALARYREALALNPFDVDSHHGLGWTLEQMHRLEEAVDAYREAVRLNPRADGSHNNLGNCLQALGHFDAAHDAYRRAIESAPQTPLYYRNLVQTKRLEPDDPVFAGIEQLAANAASLSPVQQAEVHFAYGQALSDVGRHDASFDHFLKGNALYRPGVPYKEAESLHLFEQLPKWLAADVLASKHGLGDPSAAPVFIVGMPRSGSTLIEQILASHPRVAGAGERTEFGEALVKAITRATDDPLRLDIEHAQTFDAAALKALGADYLRRIEASLAAIQGGAHEAARGAALSSPSDGPACTHFTDKYPFNFMNVGLIHLALPNARFIHSTRAPLPTCLSIFSRIFQDVPFGYDLGELGRYYRAYDRLMAYWQRVLPEGVMIEVRYEALVEDVEVNVRRMLAHCGLDWDARCLAFHETARQVTTASSAQVRQPLYKTALRRWQPRQALLQPLLDGLGAGLAEVEGQGQAQVQASSENRERE